MEVKLAHVSGQVRDFIRASSLEKDFGTLKADTHIHDFLNEYSKERDFDDLNNKK